MKKILRITILVAIILTLLFAFAACENSSPINPPESIESDNQPESATAGAPILGEIYGTWTMPIDPSEGFYSIFVFNRDGTGSLSSTHNDPTREASEPFSWSIYGNILSIDYDNMELVAQIIIELADDVLFIASIHEDGTTGEQNAFRRVE